jgi:site-specific DNA recombinase
VAGGLDVVARKAQLTDNSVMPAKWEPVGTGKTYRELWSDETTDRRQVLRDWGIRLVLHCPPRGTTTQTKVIPWEIQVPEGWPMLEVVALPINHDMDTRVAARKA